MKKRIGMCRARIRLPKLIRDMAAEDTLIITRRGRPIARLTHPTPEDIRPSGRTVWGGTVPVEDLTMEYIKEGDEEVLKLFGL